MNLRKRRPLRWIRRILGFALGFIALLLALSALLVVVSALSNLGLPTRADNDRLAEEQRARTAEAIHLRKHLGDRVWPGWGSLDIPQIVYNERYAFLTAYPGTPPPGWYREPAHERVGGPWRLIPSDSLAGEPVYMQQLPDGISPQAFTVRVGDHWAGSIPTLEWSRVRLGREIRGQLPPVLEWIPPYRLLGILFFRGSEHQVAITLHETFHAFQALRSPMEFSAAESSVSLGNAYPWDESGVVTAWRQELEILADAVEAADVEEKKRLAAAFLDARSQRRLQLPTEFREYEKRREWLEGLAKFVELEIWWAADTTSSYQPVALARANGFSGYESAASAFDQEMHQLRRSATQGETVFYYSGMAQAKLLDQLGRSWKGEAVPGGRFLEDLLHEAVDQPAPGEELTLAMAAATDRVGQRRLWLGFDPSTPVAARFRTSVRSSVGRHRLMIVTTGGSARLPLAVRPAGGTRQASYGVSSRASCTSRCRPPY